MDLLEGNHQVGNDNINIKNPFFICPPWFLVAVEIF